MAKRPNRESAGERRRKRELAQYLRRTLPPEDAGVLDGETAERVFELAAYQFAVFLTVTGKGDLRIAPQHLRDEVLDWFNEKAAKEAVREEAGLVQDPLRHEFGAALRAQLEAPEH